MNASTTRIQRRSRYGRHAIRHGTQLLQLGADRLGSRRRHARVMRQASQYWLQSKDSGWKSNSHWRDGIGDEAWLEVGREHLSMYRMFAAALGLRRDPGIVMEWGCGGGANAVVFAPEAEKIIVADVAQESVDECIAQVRAVSDTPIEGVLIDIRDPASAVADRADSCDTFLCMYVIELTAGPDEAVEILRIAERVLVKGGMGVVQIRYHTADPATRGRRRRNYRRHLAHTTTFGIDEFWLKIQECGLTPRLLTLVPENRLDVRYAYYALTKS